MLKSLKKKLESTVNFPSPPAVALQIIALVGEADIDFSKVAAAISRDPGLTVKILRVANSPLYSKRRKSENLRQALVNLGLNTATTLALSFSLLTNYKSGRGSGIDYTHFWRRAILCASAARLLGSLKNAAALEDLFLAALLQDIAMLAIDRNDPAFYASVAADSPHAANSVLEKQVLGADHAELGGWLLRHWKLPEPLCALVESSHEPDSVDAVMTTGISARCIALASHCVEVLLAPAPPTDLGALADDARRWLDITPDALTEVMATLVAEIPEIERLFDSKLLEPRVADSMLERARELLTFRTMQALDQVNHLSDSLALLEARTAALEHQHRRDALTGLFNRGHLDAVLEREFSSARAGGWPLSVVFADLDRFKLVNDTYGHPAGDAVLTSTARIIMDVVRDEDVVARYGGEEFVIVLPGIGTDAARRVCERLLARLRDTRHEVPGGTIRATASLGLATHSISQPFESVAALLAAADRSVYSAKRAGRDRLVECGWDDAPPAAALRH